LADFVSGDLTVPQRLPMRALSINRGQEPEDVREGDLLDGAELVDAERTERQSGPADAHLTATASALFYQLWGRLELAGSGDPAVLGALKAG
jgi:hypothetical protein